MDFQGAETSWGGLICVYGAGRSSDPEIGISPLNKNGELIFHLPWTVTLKNPETGNFGSLSLIILLEATHIHGTSFDPISWCWQEVLHQSQLDRIMHCFCELLCCCYYLLTKTLKLDNCRPAGVLPDYTFIQKSPGCVHWPLRGFHTMLLSNESPAHFHTPFSHLFSKFQQKRETE